MYVKIDRKIARNKYAKGSEKTIQNKQEETKANRMRELTKNKETISYKKEHIWTNINSRISKFIIIIFIIKDIKIKDKVKDIDLNSTTGKYSIIHCGSCFNIENKT